MGALEFYALDVTYSLSGKVHAGSFALIEGVVESYNVNDASQPIASTEFKNDGSFEFPSLVPGSYFFRAVPDNPIDFNATWFGDEINMANAISINVDDIIFDVDIHLVRQTVTNENEMRQVELDIFPNRAIEIVNVKSSSNIKEIVIYDSYRTQTKYFYGNNSRIMVSGLRPGVYIMSVVTEMKTVHRQLVIQ